MQPMMQALLRSLTGRTDPRLIVPALIAAALFAACSARPTPVNDTANRPERLARSININTATSEELQRIPHIGEAVAERVIEFRETHGPFRRTEQLMQIRGISDARYRAIRHLIRTE